MSYIGNELQNQSSESYVGRSVATQGQTSFTTSRAYVPGTNSLKVFVNGVRQSTSNYAETNTNTVTFSVGLDAGDVVLFEISNLIQQITAQPGNMSYTPPGGTPSNVSDALDRALTGTGYSFRNLLMNGTGFINQRGAGTSVGNGYATDRWQAQFNAATAAFTAARVLDASVSEYMGSHIMLGTSTTKASLAAGEYSMLAQRCEGYITRALRYGTANAKTTTLSFRAKSLSVNNFVMGVAVRNSNGTRSYVTSVIINPTAQRYVITIPGDTSGTWVEDNTFGAGINFTHACGTTYSTSTLDAWQAGNYIAPASQTNGLATLNEAISISDVQWEIGNIATQFEVVPFDQELSRCQRYYEKSFPYTTVPAQNAGTSGSSMGLAGRATTGQQYVRLEYKEPKRAVPTTITLYNPQAANANVRDQSSGTDCSSPSVLVSGEKGAIILTNGSASTAIGNLLIVQWTAEAEV